MEALELILTKIAPERRRRIVGSIFTLEMVKPNDVEYLENPNQPEIDTEIEDFLDTYEEEPLDPEGADADGDSEAEQDFDFYDNATNELNAPSSGGDL